MPFKSSSKSTSKTKSKSSSSRYTKQWSLLAIEASLTSATKYIASDARSLEESDFRTERETARIIKEASDTASEAVTYFYSLRNAEDEEAIEAKKASIRAVVASREIVTDILSRSKMPDGTKRVVKQGLHNAAYGLQEALSAKWSQSRQQVLNDHLWSVANNVKQKLRANQAIDLKNL